MRSKNDGREKMVEVMDNPIGIVGLDLDGQIFCKSLLRVEGI